MTPPPSPAMIWMNRLLLVCVIVCAAPAAFLCWEWVTYIVYGSALISTWDVNRVAALVMLSIPASACAVLSGGALLENIEHGR